jgi:cytochrome P450 family 138
MSDAITTPPTPPAPLAVRLPPAPPIPKAVQGLAWFLARRWTFQQLARRYGSVYAMNVPIFGHTVVVTDAALVKQIFTSSPEDLGTLQPNMGKLLGSGCLFALDGDPHRRRRRLLTPPLHGKSAKNSQAVIEEEITREIAGWPEGQPFPTWPSMMHVTLNSILRAVFGAAGPELEELRRLVPPWMELGSRLALLPIPQRTYGHYSPWGRLADWRRRYEVIIDKLIEDQRADPDFDQRTDVLALMLRSTYEDGSVMSRKDIGDELLGLVGAGHETTAATLAWAFERLSRHPEVLAALVEEADTDKNELRQAALLEVQRNRTVIDLSGRHVLAPTFEVGEWVIPQGYTVFVNIPAMHSNPEIFPDPERFDPQRFIAAKPSNLGWMPFGGGTRRCIGAAFANLEMDVVLRTVLRHFTIETTTAPGEKWHTRGIAFTPKDGGRIVVHRRHH